VWSAYNDVLGEHCGPTGAVRTLTAHAEQDGLILYRSGADGLPPASSSINLGDDV
jgi:hypothetical protein